MVFSHDPRNGKNPFHGNRNPFGRLWRVQSLAHYAKSRGPSSSFRYLETWYFIGRLRRGPLRKCHGVGKEMGREDARAFWPIFEGLQPFRDLTGCRDFFPTFYFFENRLPDHQLVVATFKWGRSIIQERVRKGFAVLPAWNFDLFWRTKNMERYV